MTELLTDTAEAELAGAGGEVGEVGKAATEAVPDDVSRCIGAVACAGCPLAQFCPKVPSPEVPERAVVEEESVESEEAPEDEPVVQPVLLRPPEPMVRTAETVFTPPTPERKSRPYLDLLMDDAVPEVRAQLVERVVPETEPEPVAVENSGKSISGGVTVAETVVERPLDIASSPPDVAESTPDIAPTLDIAPTYVEPTLHVEPTLDIAYDTPDIAVVASAAVPLSAPDVTAEAIAVELPVDESAWREDFDEPDTGSKEGTAEVQADSVSLGDQEVFTQPIAVVHEELAEVSVSNEPEPVAPEDWTVFTGEQPATVELSADEPEGVSAEPVSDYIEDIPEVLGVTFRSDVTTAEDGLADAHDSRAFDQVQSDMEAEQPELLEHAAMDEVFLDDVVCETDNYLEVFDVPNPSIKTAESRVDTEAFVEPRSPIPAQAAAVELAVSSEEVLPPEDVLVEEGVLHVDDIQHSVELAPRYFWLDVESGERETTAAWAVEEAPSKHALRHIFSTSSATWPKGDVSHRLAMVVFGLIGLHSQYAKIYR